MAELDGSDLETHTRARSRMSIGQLMFTVVAVAIGVALGVTMSLYLDPVGGPIPTPAPPLL